MIRRLKIRFVNGSCEFAESCANFGGVYCKPYAVDYVDVYCDGYSICVW